MSATPTATATPSPTTPSSTTPSTPSTTTSTLSTTTTTSSPSINAAASTAASTTSTSTSTSTSTNASSYQIPNMNVYISKSTCRDLSIIHHANTETNVHPATLLARVNLNEAQLFYLRSHSAAYPIVTTLYALPQEDWFECRIYPYPNGIPPMMIPPPPLPAITGTATTQPSTGAGSGAAATPSAAPTPSPLVPSGSMCSLFLGSAPSPSPYYDYGYTNSPTAKFHKNIGLSSPIPMVSNMYDNWNLRRSNSQISLQSPGTPTPSSLSTLSTLNSSPSLNAFPAFMQHEVVSAAALAQQGSFTQQHPYTSQFLPNATASTPSTSNPAVNHNINIQHIQYQMRAPPSTTPIPKNEPIIVDSTKLSRKRKVSMEKETKKKKNKITKRTTRSSTRSKNIDEEEEEEEEEVQSEPSTPSSPADDFEEVDEPDPTGDHSMESLLKRRKSTELENSRRKKVLKKVYKKRYQQKKSIKRKIARFHTTGDKAVVIFVTRNSQRKYGFDVEFYNPTSSTNDFMNKFWREQQPLVESYIQQHFSKHKTDMELPDPIPSNKHNTTTTTHHIQPQPTYPTSSPPSSSSLPVLEFIGTHPPSMSSTVTQTKLYPHHTSQTSQIISMPTPHLESPPHTIEAAA